MSFVIGLSFDYLTIFGGSRGLFFGIKYKFNSIICILYIYIKIKEDFYIIFPGIRPGAAFVVVVDLPSKTAVRPLLGLIR